MRRLFPLLLLACDSPFFDSVRAQEPACDYQVDIRCDDFFPVFRPEVRIEPPCTVHVDASELDPLWQFDVEIGEEIVLTSGACQVIGDEVECPGCTFALIEDEPAPYRIEREHCTLESCETAQRPFGYNGTRLSFPLTQVGHLIELVAESTPIYVANRVYQDDTACPTDSRIVDYGFVAIDRIVPGEPCVHTLEPAGDAYVGVFGSGGVLRVGRFSFDDLTLTSSRAIDLGEPPETYYNVQALAYDADSGRVLIGLNSSARSNYLMLYDAETLALIRMLELPPISETEQHYSFGIQTTRTGWLFADDGEHSLRELTPDLSATIWSAAIFDVLGRSDLGSILATDEGSITVDMNRSRLVLEADRRIAGTAGAIADEVLTPTSIGWAGDLIAVGLLDKRDDNAYVGFFDPERLRFLPGIVPIGLGAVGRIRSKGDRLWIILPWQGKLVELVADDT